MNEPTRRAILAELIAASDVPKPQQPHEFTRAQFMEEAGCTYEMAARALKQLVQAGTVHQRPAVVDGKSCILYWRPEDVPK